METGQEDRRDPLAFARECFIIYIIGMVMWAGIIWLIAWIVG